MSITTLKYRLDLTGELQENRIKHEQQIGVNTGRSFALPYGAFYAHNLSLIDSSRPQKPLERGIDYELLYLYSRVSKMAKGKEVVGVIKIINDKVGTEITCYANIVGAEFVNHYQFIVKAIEDLQIDNRETQFWNIEGVPQVWEAADHLQDIGDVFGFEYIISILSELVSVVSSGAAPEIKAILDSLSAIESRLRDTLQAHISATGNVHSVTPGQIGTYTSIELDEAFTAVRGLIDELAERLLRAEQINEEQALDLQSMGDMFTTHTQTLSNLRHDLTALVQNAGDANQEIALLKDQDVEHSRRLDALQADLERNWQDQRELLNVVSDNTTEITRLKERADSTDGRVEALEAALTRLGVGAITISSTAPSNPMEKDIWIQI